MMTEKPVAEKPKQEKATLTFLTSEEKKMAKSLGKLLYAHGKIEKPTVEAVLRISLWYLSQEVLETLRRQRYD